MSKLQLCVCVTFFYFTLIVLIDSQTCNDKCFINVGKALDNVRNQMKNKPEINITWSYENITRLINRLNSIGPNITNLKNVSGMINDINNNFLNFEVKSEEVKKGTDLFSLLKRVLQNLDEIKKYHESAITKCQNAEKDYTRLRNILNRINRVGNQLLDQSDINLSKYNKTINDALNSMQAFDHMKIDDSAFAGYQCNPRVQEAILGMISILKNIENILKRIFKHILDKLITERHEMRKTIDYILNIDKTISETNIRVSNESNRQIRMLRGKLEDLKKKIKYFKFDTSISNVLDDIKNNNDILLKDFETILEFIFSKSQITKTREELQKAKDILKLFEDKEKIGEELQKLKRITANLYTSEVCNVTENIELEDKKIISN